MNAHELATEIVANADGKQPTDPKIDIDAIIEIITTIMALFEDCDLTPPQMAQRSQKMEIKDKAQLRMALRDNGFFGRRRRAMARSIEDCCERHPTDTIEEAIQELSEWSFL